MLNFTELLFISLNSIFIFAWWLLAFVNIFIRIYKNINNRLFLSAMLISGYNISFFFLIIELLRLGELEDIIFILISIFFESRAKGLDIKFSIYLIFIISISFYIFIIRFINYNNCEKEEIKTRDFLYK